MSSRLLLLVVAGCVSFHDLSGQTAKPKVPVITISQLKSSPLHYDGKLLQIGGWLSSGHLGVFIYDELRQSSVRLRPSDEVEGFTQMEVHDTLLERLWTVAETATTGKESKHYVKIEGVVRVLKKEGKPAESFNVFGQFPIEVIVIRVLSISGQ